MVLFDILSKQQEEKFNELRLIALEMVESVNKLYPHHNGSHLKYRNFLLTQSLPKFSSLKPPILTLWEASLIITLVIAGDLSMIVAVGVLTAAANNAKDPLKYLISTLALKNLKNIATAKATERNNLLSSKPNPRKRETGKKRRKNSCKKRCKHLWKSTGI